MYFERTDKERVSKGFTKEIKLVKSNMILENYERMVYGVTSKIYGVSTNNMDNRYILEKGPYKEWVLIPVDPNEGGYTGLNRDYYSSTLWKALYYLDQCKYNIYNISTIGWLVEWIHGTNIEVPNSYYWKNTSLSVINFEV